MHIKLNGKNLPLVDSSKHLGVRVGNMSKGLSRDMMEKIALYVHKVNEIIQEFHYADPSTKIMINNIFNTSFMVPNCGICSIMKPKDWKNLGTSHKELC